MTAFGWSALLFILKWVFIGLVYFALFVVLKEVRRELRARVNVENRPAAIAPGRIRVIRGGSDDHLSPGTIINLQLESAIGSGQENDIILTDQFISRRHARLRWDGIRWWIEDQGSKNGTYVNGQRTVSFQPQMIPMGATIQMGDMAFDLIE